MENKRQLIYVDDARRAIEHYDPAFSYVIDNVPTVDAVEVVHGRWLYEPVEFTYEKDIKCSVCGRYVDEPENYCPNCGAKMDGDGNG